VAGDAIANTPVPLLEKVIVPICEPFFLILKTAAPVEAVARVAMLPVQFTGRVKARTALIVMRVALLP
jgi:hypothetical protein